MSESLDRQSSKEKGRGVDRTSTKKKIKKMDALDPNVFERIAPEDRVLLEKVCVQMLRSMDDGIAATNYTIQSVVKDEGKPQNVDYVISAEYPSGRIGLDAMQKIKQIHQIRVIRLMVESRFVDVPSSSSDLGTRFECGLKLICVVGGRLNTLENLKIQSTIPAPSAKRHRS